MLNNKGQMRTIEAFLSILLLFSALALTTLVSPASNIESDKNLTSLGMQALLSIDIDGQLGKLVDQANWTTLTQILNILLPSGISYNLTVYDENMNALNDVSISNGLIYDRNVVSTHYPCASPTLQSRCYLLRLQLAVAE